MATVPHPTFAKIQNKSFVERWFFPGVASAMIAICLVAFVPSMAHPEGRHAPVSAMAAAHGVVFFAWLLLFLVQSSLVATRHVGLHRKLGFASIALLALMIPLAYETTITMIRRGFDLSGDLHAAVNTPNDPVYQAGFGFCNLLIFTVLVIAAILYRRRPEMHKRLILFANIELMPAPLAHLIGHSPTLNAMPPAIVMVPISLFVIAALGRDWIVARRIHPLTVGLALLRIVSGPLEAGPIGHSAAWQHFAYWLAR